MVEVKKLYHDYTGQGSYAVEDVSFTIEDSQIYGFLGPSGAGKSTVQNIMTKLLPIQQGDVIYDGENIRDIRRGFFNKIGYSFEHPNVYTKLTGYENLKYFAGLFAGETEDPQRLLDMVGLGTSAHKRAGRYSKGMKQRLVFARSIINNPKILFLDEPLSGLDPGTADVLKGIIHNLRKQGATILMTTHNMHAADELCDVVAFLNEGRIVAADRPRDLKLKYGEPGIKVEYTGEHGTESRVFKLDEADDKREFDGLVTSGNIETIHSQEATLEAIFKKLTGRGLKE